MLAKIIYFNWQKAYDEDRKRDEKNVLSLRSVTWTGELLPDRVDLYDHVGDLDTTPDEHGCDVAFRKFNRVEDGDMAGMNIRSMSVGDIVLFEDSSMFVCQGMGWKKIPAGIDKLAFWALPKVDSQ